MKIMTFGEKIKEICKLEGINLKKFSRLCEIPYESIKSYSQDRRTPTWDQIQKIADVPQFFPHKNMLLSLDDPDSNKTEEAEFIALLRRLKEADKENEALDYLRYMLDRANKQ